MPLHRRIRVLSQQHPVQGTWPAGYPLWYKLALGLCGPVQVNHVSVCCPTLATTPHTTWTLMQLSDIHMGWNTQPWLEALLPLLHQWASPHARHPVDAVVLTGDFIARGQAHLPALGQWLQGLPAHLPRFACMGNHDYDDGERGEALRATLAQAAVQVLQNTHTLLPPQQGQAAPLVLHGLEDYLKGMPDPEGLWQQAQQLQGTHPTSPQVLLCHNPSQLETLGPWHPIDLTLSGHTHGGQFGVPALVGRALSGCRHVKGPYSVPTTAPQQPALLYVNQGTATASIAFKKEGGKGAWVLPVPRWGLRPEVTLITLMAPQAFDATWPVWLAKANNPY